MEFPVVGLFQDAGDRRGRPELAARSRNATAIQLAGDCPQPKALSVELLHLRLDLVVEVGEVRGDHVTTLDQRLGWPGVAEAGASRLCP